MARTALGRCCSTASGGTAGIHLCGDGAGTVLTVSQFQDGVNVSVLQVVLTDRTSGNYTVTQLHAINHAPGLDEEQPGHYDQL